jgi:HK97 family phage major capsid protein
MQKLFRSQVMNREDLFREGRILLRSAKADSRTVDLSLSSEYPVPQDGYLEILDHSSPDSVNLTRLNNGAPLLLNHDTNTQIGIVERAWLDSRLKRCRCTVRFSRGKLGDEVFQDVKDLIRRNVSVGYRHLKQLGQTEKGDQGQTSVRFAWEPFEVSICSVAADPSVGIGRSRARPRESIDGEAEVLQEVEESLAKCDNCGWKGTWEDTINDLCPQCGLEASEERSYVSVEEFESEVKHMKSNIQEHAKVKLLGLSADEIKKFSICRAIQEYAQYGGISGLELEVYKAGVKMFPGQILGGIFIPPDIMTGIRSDPVISRRDLSAGGMGGDFVQTDVTTPIIELLRNKLQCARAGAQVLAGLEGGIFIPRQKSTATVQVLTEQGALTQSTPDIGGVAMTPHRAGASIRFSRQLMVQSSVDVEMFVRNDLAAALAVQHDYLILNGSGGVQPIGVVNTSGIASVTFGGAATWAKITSFLKALTDANADIGKLGWITSSAVRDKFLNTVKVASYPVYLWEDPLTSGADGRVCYLPAFVTNQVVGDKVLLANWMDAVIGFWSGLDLVVDPFTSAATASINVTANSYFDVAIRHPESFCLSVDSGTQ